MKNKIILGLATTSLVWISHTPYIVRKGMTVTFFMILVDTITAVLAAIAVRELRSSRMRDKLVFKTLQYAVLITLTYLATLISDTWLFFEAGIGAIIAIESTSMLENLSRWQKYSGLDFGSISNILRLVSGYFQSTPEEDKHTVVTTATTIPPHPENQPSISVTSVDTFEGGKDSKGIKDKEKEGTNKL